MNGRLLEADQSLSEVEISVNRSNFGRAYGGVFLLYEKTDFARDSVRPKDSDRLIGTQLYDQYRNNFLIDGQPLYVVETLNSVRLTPTQEAATPQTRVLPLQTKLNLQAENIQSFSVQLVEYLKQQALTRYPIVSAKLFGLHQIADSKEYDGQVVSYDDQSGEGLYISFSTSEETGNINNFFVLKIGRSIEAYDPMVVPLSAENQPLQKVAVEIPALDFVGDEIGTIQVQKLPYYTTLSGVRLNDLIKVTDMDILARNEATIEFVEPFSVNSLLPAEIAQNIGATQRSYYTDQGELYLPGANNSLQPRSQHFTNVSSFGVGLGVVPVGVGPNGESYVRVVSISSGFVNGEIHDLCGLNNFKPRFQMKDLDFVEALESALALESKTCEYFLSRDDTSNQNITAMYFPQDRLRLSFDQHELVGAMIYMPLNEVKPMPAQGGVQ